MKRTNHCSFSIFYCHLLFWQHRTSISLHAVFKKKKKVFQKNAKQNSLSWIYLSVLNGFSLTLYFSSLQYTLKTIHMWHSEKFIKIVGCQNCFQIGTLGTYAPTGLNLSIQPPSLTVRPTRISLKTHDFQSLFCVFTKMGSYQGARAVCPNVRSPSDDIVQMLLKAI